MASEDARQEARDEIRQEIIKQSIILAFGVVTLILYTIGQRRMGEPDFTHDVAVKLGFTKAAKRDKEKELLRQVQREISWMEHGIPDSFGPECGGVYG
jgi:hypothetical protein